MSPKVTFVKKARKDVPGSDIKAGESYYWWKFRFGGKHVSRAHPKPSQLTQSEYLQAVLGWEERVSTAEPVSTDDIESLVNEIKDEAENLKSEMEDKLSNMPEGLQEGEVGQMMQERIDYLDNLVSDLEGIELEYTEPDEDEIAAVIEDADDFEIEGDDDGTRAREYLRKVLAEEDAPATPAPEPAPTPATQEPAAAGLEQYLSTTPDPATPEPVDDDDEVESEEDYLKRLREAVKEARENLRTEWVEERMSELQDIDLSGGC